MAVVVVASTTVIAVGGGLIVVVFLAIAVFVASRILTSDIGLELFVLGVDERTAAAMGVRTPRRKLELFVLGCVFAALGGAVYAGTQQFVPETLGRPDVRARAADHAVHRRAAVASSARSSARWSSSTCRAPATG